MNLKYRWKVFIAGMAIFSMFFGGGNLIFPLWIGSDSSSVFITSLGFILSGVILPFFGIAVILYFKGDYEKCFSVFGKTLGSLLAFTLLVFWIPLGSGPRCNLLAYGAYSCQIEHAMPLWLYSALYSAVVYLLTFKKTRFLDILGKIITPLLIFAIFFLIVSIFRSSGMESLGKSSFKWHEFLASIVAGYNTMDFIAAIFFASTVIAILKEKEKAKFDLNFVRNACIVAIILLSLVYIGMISVGHVNAEILADVTGDKLLVAIGQALFDMKFQLVIFAVITLSVLSTSMALALVFSEYMRKTLFKNKLPHGVCLFITVLISYLISIIGFERLAALISHMMTVLYPLLLVVTATAFVKKMRSTEVDALSER